MRTEKIFQKTEIKTCDILAADGGVGVGCYVSEGKIKPALNSVVKKNTLMPDIVRAEYFDGVKKYVVLCNNYVFASDGEMYRPKMKRVVAAEPSFIELQTKEKNSLNILGDEYYGEIVQEATSIVTYPFEAGVNCCVLKNGRIFGIDSQNRYKIKWSGEGGLDDWTEDIAGAGWAFVQRGTGEILNLAVYRNTVVAVREFGLTFLSAFGNPENFKLSYPDIELPKIYKNTAATVDGKLVFYTEDGLYSYHGNGVEKSGLNLAKEITSPRYAIARNGKYYLVGESKTLARRAVLVVDVREKYCYLLDFDADAISVGDRVFAYADRYEYEVTSGGEYAFTSGILDFGTDGEKVLKEVKISADGEVGLKVSNGVISRIVRGVRGKYRPHMRGKNFKITLSGTGRIDGAEAVAEAVCGV